MLLSVKFLNAELLIEAKLDGFCACGKTRHAPIEEKMARFALAAVHEGFR